MRTQLVIDEDRLEGLRTQVIQKKGSLVSRLGRFSVAQALIWLPLFFLFMSFADGRLPTTADFSGRRLAVGLIGAGLIALWSGAIAYRQWRYILRTSLAEHRSDLEQEWAKLLGPKWWWRTLGWGLFIAIGVGIPIGILLAFTLDPAELPAGSKSLMVWYFLGFTALWAFPAAFGIRWLTIYRYRRLGRESAGS